MSAQPMTVLLWISSHKTIFRISHNIDYAIFVIRRLGYKCCIAAASALIGKTACGGPTPGLVALPFIPGSFVS